MISMRIPIACAAVAAAFTLFVPGTASAACFENAVGCTNTHTIPLSVLRRLSCDALWTVRNTIYYENGYCFHTRRGQAAFDNSGCTYDDAGMVPLNSNERTNIGRITRVEREKGCR